MRCGVDTGGTFTDVVADDGRSPRSCARPTTRAGPSPTGWPAPSAGAPTCWPTGRPWPPTPSSSGGGRWSPWSPTPGFADVIEIARQDRPSLYDQWADRPEPLVPRHLRLEVDGRLDADRRRDRAGRADAVPTVPDGVEAVAVCLLHADLDPAHERAVAAGCGPGASTSPARPTCRPSSGSTSAPSRPSSTPTCGPGAATTCAGLDRLADEVLVMTSAGGLVPADEAAELPVALLLSGPAGGVVAGAAAAAAAGFADAVTFDMGGTSTDVCLVQGGVPEPAPGRMAAGFPVRLPALDIHTIGAGGGSIASHRPRRRPGRRARRAPAPIPGPACYGRGGRRPTVTDADLVLGRIPADAAFGDLGRARRRRRPGRPRRRRASPPRGWWRWSTRPWSGRCGRSPSSGASTRRSWPWWPSAAPARCTPAPWPRPWAWPPSSSRPGPACCRPSACCARPASATWCGRGRRPATTPAWTRRAAALADEAGGGRRVGGAGAEVTTAVRLPVRRARATS